MTNSMEHYIASIVSGRNGALDQKFIEFSGPLITSPISNPQDVSRFRAIEGIEAADVGGFVEGPNPRHAKTVGVDLANGFTEGKHAVKEVQIKAQDLSRIGIG